MCYFQLILLQKASSIKVAAFDHPFINSLTGQVRFFLKDFKSKIWQDILEKCFVKIFNDEGIRILIIHASLVFSTENYWCPWFMCLVMMKIFVFFVMGNSSQWARPPKYDELLSLRHFIFIFAGDFVWHWRDFCKVNHCQEIMFNKNILISDFVFKIIGLYLKYVNEKYDFL